MRQEVEVGGGRISTWKSANGRVSSVMKKAAASWKRFAGSNALPASAASSRFVISARIAGENLGFKGDDEDEEIVKYSS